MFTKPGTDTRYLHARFAIEERDIRDISSVFITGVLDLMRYVEDNWELLVRDIERGTIDASIQMPADVRAGLEARIKPNPERAAELRAIFERGFDEPITPAMWPSLLVVRSVAGGGFAPYTQRLRRFIGNDVHILYTGYSASEGAFSVPFHGRPFERAAAAAHGIHAPGQRASAGHRGHRRHERVRRDIQSGGGLRA